MNIIYVILFFFFLLLNPPQPEILDGKSTQREVEPVVEVEPVLEPAVDPKPVVNTAFPIGMPFAGNTAPTNFFGNGHTGIDFPLHWYTHILACDDGVVESISYDNIFGDHIWIRHSWGRSLYAHLHTWNYVTVGQQVVKGQEISQSGASGDSFDDQGVRAPHLHFAIQVNGSYVDAYPYLYY